MTMRGAWSQTCPPRGNDDVGVVSSVLLGFFLKGGVETTPGCTRNDPTPWGRFGYCGRNGYTSTVHKHSPTTTYDVGHASRLPAAAKISPNE